MYDDISKEKIIKLTHLSSPRVTRIIRSGWDGMFHVITEDPEDGDQDYQHYFMSRNKIKLSFNIDPETGDFAK